MDEISKCFKEWMQKLIIKNNKLKEEIRAWEEECKDREKVRQKEKEEQE